MSEVREDSVDKWKIIFHKIPSYHQNVNPLSVKLFHYFKTEVMKNLLLFLLIMSIGHTAFSQDKERQLEVEKQKSYYATLRKQNQTAGRILLYGGAGVIVAPFIISAVIGGDHPLTYGTALLGFPIGIASMIVSTTYFNRAARLKKKIASINFINQPLDFPGSAEIMWISTNDHSATQIKNSRLLLKTIPAVSLKINL